MQRSLVFVDGLIIDGTGREPVDRGEVAIENGAISYCGPIRPSASRPPDAKVVDVAGKTLLPGLVDAHIHMVLPGDATGLPVPGRDTYAVLRCAADMRRTLEAGFTTIRDLGGRNYLEMDLRQAIGEGALPGPRMVLCGKIISVSTSGADMYQGMYREADSAEEVRKGAREQLKAGADFVKLMTTGYAPGEDPERAQYTVEEIRAAVEVARAAGKKVATHAQGLAGIRNCVQAGVNTIEHGCDLCLDERLAGEMARSGIFLVPTLSLYEPLRDRELWEGLPDFARSVIERFHPGKADSIRIAKAAGVRIVAGTDGGVPGAPHGGNARELRLLVEAGLTPMEAIRAASAEAAAAIGLEHQVGTLEPGKAGDLVVVDGNPLEDIATLERSEAIWAVVKAGELISATRRAEPDG